MVMVVGGFTHHTAPLGPAGPGGFSEAEYPNLDASGTLTDGKIMCGACTKAWVIVERLFDPNGESFYCQ